MTTPVINLQAVFLNGSSLEVPDRARFNGLTGDIPMSININASNRQLSDELYEVSVRVTLESKHEGKDLYVAELTQAGIFTIQADKALMGQILYKACPAIILPYLRSNLADLLLRAQLPIVHLPDVNWVDPGEQNAVQNPDVPKLVH